MKKSDVLRHFGHSYSLIAQELGITRQAVYLWGKWVPEGQAYKLQAITRGRLQVNPRAYAKKPKPGRRKVAKLPPVVIEPTSRWDATPDQIAELDGT